MTSNTKAASTSRRYFSIFIGNLPSKSVPNHIAAEGGTPIYHARTQDVSSVPRNQPDHAAATDS
jgi:hypothetical protein